MRKPFCSEEYEEQRRISVDLTDLTTISHGAVPRKMGRRWVPCGSGTDAGGGAGMDG